MRLPLIPGRDGLFTAGFQGSGPIHVNLNPGCSRFSEPLRLLVLYTPHSAARGDPNKIREKHKKAITLKSAGFNHNSN